VRAIRYLPFTLCVPLLLAGQSVGVTGRVLHRGERPRPLANQWALLYEIHPGLGEGAPADSAPTDAAGRYRLTLSRRDAAALYYVVTTYQGVEYFSEALPLQGAARIDVAPLAVYDTTSGGPAMRVERRLITVLGSGELDSRTVLDIVEVSNPGSRTRVAQDSLSPVWTMVLPAGAREWEATTADLTPEAMRLRGDTVRMFAPIWPGAPLRISHRYAVTGPTLHIPVDQWMGELGLLLEDTMATVSGSGPSLQALGVRDSEGRRLGAYRGGPLDAGSAVRVAFSRAPLTAARLMPYVVGAVALALAAGLWVALRRGVTAAA